MNPIEMLLDENNTDNIILYNEEGEAIEFEQIALVPLDGKVYAILRPILELEGMAEDEALVFSIEELEDDERALTIVGDDAVVDAVFDEYYAMLEDAGVDVE